MKKHVKLFAGLLSIMMCGGLVSCGLPGKEVVDEPAVNTTSTIGDISKDTIKLSMNGSITEISCENYKEDGISVIGLEEYINNEINVYNESRGASKVTLIEYKDDGSVVKTAIQYSDIDTYNEFNNTDVNISLYNKSEVSRLFEEDNAKHPKAVSYVKAEEISEEELAAAGYSLEDIKAMQSSTDATASETDAVATFTDAASASTVLFDEIEGDSYMMLTTGLDVDVIINGGNVLYINKYGEVISDNTADLSGEGKAIVVYSYNY